MIGCVRVLHVNHPHSTTEFPLSYFILKVTTFVQVLQFNKTQLLRFLMMQAHPHPDSRNLQVVPYLRILERRETLTACDAMSGVSIVIQNLEALPLNGTACEITVVQACLAP